jgi:septum formation topological specificity factor MinE
MEVISSYVNVDMVKIKILQKGQVKIEVLQKVLKIGG